MIQHKLKIREKWYRRLGNGKNSELRENDRDYQVGDMIQFWVEYNYDVRDANSRYEDIEDENGKVQTYECVEDLYAITHVLTSDSCDGLLPSYCILSIEKTSND